jgi:hypothetical protein
MTLATTRVLNRGDFMTEREQLEQVSAPLETQRAILGDTMAEDSPQAKRATVRKLLLLPIDLYAASMTAYLLLRLLTKEDFWPVELISLVCHWLLLLAVLLLPVRMSRRWRVWPWRAEPRS